MQAVADHRDNGYPQDKSAGYSRYSKAFDCRGRNGHGDDKPWVRLKLSRSPNPYLGADQQMEVA